MQLNYEEWLAKHMEGGSEYVDAKTYAAMNEMTEQEVLASRSKGLGDTISKITHALGISECGGCKQRKDWLNKKVPYAG